MMTAMNLNLNALTDEFEETYEYSAPLDRIESGTNIAKRERDERRKRLRRDRGDERSFNASQQSDQFYPSKHAKNYEKSRLPSGIANTTEFRRRLTEFSEFRRRRTEEQETQSSSWNYSTPPPPGIFHNFQEMKPNLSFSLDGLGAYRTQLPDTFEGIFVFVS